MISDGQRLWPFIIGAIMQGVTGQLQGNGNFMGQYAALPWSLAWLNPSYTGFYGGLGNVGQLNSDSSYLSGSGGQIGGGAGASGYNYATGAYGAATSLKQSLLPVVLLIFVSSVFFKCDI